MSLNFLLCFNLCFFFLFFSSEHNLSFELRFISFCYFVLFKQFRALFVWFLYFEVVFAQFTKVHDIQNEVVAINLYSFKFNLI